MSEEFSRLVGQQLLADDAKQQRCFMRRVILGILLGAFIGAALIYSVSSRATEIPVHVVEHQAVKMRLLSGSCVDPQSILMIATAPPQFQDGWKAISSQWRMKDGSWKDYAGCWLEVTKEEANTPDSVMVLIFEDGANYQILKRDLLPKAPGA